MKRKCIFLTRHSAKKVKNDHFGFTFCKSEVRVPFLKNEHFKFYFLFHSEFQFQEKWNQKGIKNEAKNE